MEIKKRKGYIILNIDWSWVLAIAILVVLLGYEVYQYTMRKKALTILTEEEFKKRLPESAINRCA